MQRYDFFPNYQNFSKKKFSFYRKKFEDLICVKAKPLLHLIIIIRTRELFLFAQTTREHPQNITTKNSTKNRINKLLQKRHSFIWLFVYIFVTLQPNLHKYSS